MARDGLFQVGDFADFGPSDFALPAANLRTPPRPAPELVQVHGPKTGGLRTAVRLQSPRKPGVYGMLDEAGELIYVGKARQLRTRLLTYFRPQSRDPKAGKILREARGICWEVWGHEFGALLREIELIRRWRPRWNVRSQPLRQRLAFLCLGRQPAPYAFLTRRPPKDAAGIYGPFPAGPRAATAVRRLNDAFALRDCPQPQEMIFPEQGELFPGERPPGCIRLEIGSCLGPCTGQCPKGRYSQQVRAARAFLDGAKLDVLPQLEQLMRQAAATERFEAAASLRDRWTSLTWLSQHLQRLRAAQETLSFIYPLTGWDNHITWYLVHGARVVGAVAAPACPQSARTAQQAVEIVFGRKELSHLLTPYEHIDGRWIVMSWFRKRPEELKRTLTADEALKSCRRLLRRRG